MYVIDIHVCSHKLITFIILQFINIIKPFLNRYGHLLLYNNNYVCDSLIVKNREIERAYISGKVFGFVYYRGVTSSSVNKKMSTARLSRLCISCTKTRTIWAPAVVILL